MTEKKKPAKKGLTQLTSKVNYSVFIKYGDSVFQLAPFEVLRGLKTSDLGEIPKEVRAYNY